MLVRGLFRRCPWCGHRGAYFDGWFAKHDACQACGLHWRRGDVGYELGAAAVAAILVLGTLALGLAVALAFMWPDIEVVPLYVILGAGAIVLPILLYPSTYTVWQAVDIVMRPVTEQDFSLEVLIDGPTGSEPAVPPVTPTAGEASGGPSGESPGQSPGSSPEGSRGSLPGESPEQAPGNPSGHDGGATPPTVRPDDA